MDNIPYLIEINPRFSGTTGIRAKFGFNDVELSIREHIGLDLENIVKVKKGFVVRYLEEIYYKM